MAANPPLPPDQQALVEHLFELFSQYVAAEDVRERRDLHAQILDLFNQLGVVSDSPLVKQAVALFETIKLDKRATPKVPPTLSNRARSFVTTNIKQHERQNAITLTSGARQLLRIPIGESVEFTEHFDPDQIDQALNTVFASLSQTPPDLLDPLRRSSIDVIRAFWKNFCRIPPFCSGTRE
jgi:hypothetical protein